MSKFYEKLDNACKEFINEFPETFVEDEEKFVVWINQANVKELVTFASALDMYDELDIHVDEYCKKYLHDVFFDMLPEDVIKILTNLIKFQKGDFVFETKNLLDFNMWDSQERTLLKEAVILNHLRFIGITPENLDLIPYLYNPDSISPYIGDVHNGTKKYSEDDWDKFLQNITDGWFDFLCNLVSKKKFDAVDQIIETAKNASICDVDANVWEHREFIKLY